MADESNPIWQELLANDKAKTQSNVIDSLDADPKRAATASQLSNDTGADPNVIYHNFDDAMREHRKALTNGIIENSPPLQEYVNSHPLAAKVSKDDWGNLSKLMDVLGAAPLTRPFSQLAKSQAFRDLLSSTTEEAKREFGSQPIGTTAEELEKIGISKSAGKYFEKTAQLPGVTPVFNPLNFITLLDLSGRVISGAFGGIAGYFGKLSEQAGMDPTTALDIEHTIKEGGELFQTFLPGIAGLGMGRLKTPKPAELLKMEEETGKRTKADYKAIEEYNKQGDTLERALPYIKEGEEPPPHLDPDIDKMIAEDSKQGLKELKDQEKATDQTITKQLDKDMVELAISKATKGANVGLEWDGVKALYGDKLPEPGDGKLGDIPGIAEKFQASMTSQEDIIVPKSQWLAKVEKETSEKLDGFVKHRPEAMSGREIEALATAKDIPPIDPGASNWQNVVDGVRRAAGLEPLFRRELAALPKPKEGTVRFYHGGDEPTIGGSRWVTPDPVYARDFRSGGTPKAVHYVDIPKGDPAEVALRAWDEQLDKGTAMEGRYQHGEIPEEWAKKLKPTEKAIKPAQLELPVTRQEDIPIFEPGALMPKKMYDQYFNQINKVIDRDKEKDLRLAEREERRKQMPEWNENYKKEQTKVVEDIKNSRSFRVSDFFRNGILNGEDTGVKPKIRTDSLTPEQQEAIPKRFQAKNGIDPDILAKPLDYQAGSQMINEMIAFEEMRAEAGDKPGEFFNRLIKKETDRRMNLKYGKFEENVAAAAQEHVISTTAFDLVHQEVMALAMQAGQKMPMSKDDLRAQAQLRFTNSIASEQDLYKYVRLLGKAGRAAEEAWLKGDVQEAFKQKQLQAQHMAVAQLAKDFQKEQRAWDRGKKAHSGEVDASLPQEYQNFLHDLYYRVGETTKRPWEAVKQSIQEHGEISFEKWANAKNEIGLPVGAGEYGDSYNPKIPFTPFLYDEPFNKKMKDVTVGEFRAINNTAQALITMGRGERTVFLGDRRVDFEEAKKKLLDWVDSLHPDKPYVHNPTRWQERREKLQAMRVGLMPLETFFRIVDAEDPRGVASTSLIYPLMAAGSKVDTTGKTYAKMLRTFDKFKEDFNAAIPNTVFHSPNTFVKDEKGVRQLKEGTPVFLDMNVENLLTIALNWGNDSNRDIVTRGHLVSAEDVQKLLDDNMTKERWQFVQGLGQILGRLQRQEDRMTMGMNQSVVDKIQLGKVQTKFGEMDGWYWPIRYDPNFAKSKTASEGVQGDKPYIRVQVAHGWTNARSGYAAPLDLHMNNVADIITRRIRHIELSPAIAEVSKLMLNDDFTESINKKFGRNFSSMFKKYLEDIAGQAGYTSRAANAGNDLGHYTLTNAVSAAIGYNPGTIFKHSLSAFGQSWREVGSKAFLKAMVDLYRGSDVVNGSNNKFIEEGGQVGNLDWKGSDEINRRPQDWEKRLGGVQQMLFRPSAMEASRQRGMERRAWILATIDQWISKVTWLAKYRLTMDENLGPRGLSVEEAHTDAVTLADRAVRNTHGSTMIAARPEFMRSKSAMVQSMTVLGIFYNHILSRWMTMGPRAVRAVGKWQRGEPVAEDVKDLTKDVMMYVVWPSVVHEMIDPTCSGKEWGSSFGTCSAKVGAMAALSPILLARDLAHAVMTGHDPSVGFFGSVFKPITDMVKDLSHIGEKKYIGNTVQHANTLLGTAMGVASTQVGRWEKYFIHTMQNQDHLPSGSPLHMAGEAWRVLRWGTTKPQRGHR